MSQKTIILFFILFTLVILGMFVYATMRKGELSALEPLVNLFS